MTKENLEQEWKDDLDEGCKRYFYSATGTKKCGEIDKKWHLSVSRFYCPKCKKRINKLQ